MPRQSKELMRGLSADGQKDLVRYLASRLPNEDDARDLAQEAYLRLIRLEKPDLVRHPEAYLFRIATNLIHEHWLRAPPESPDYHVDPDGLPASAPSSVRVAEQTEAMDVLRRALHLLPPIQQRVVLLHRREGLTYAEIAKELNISPDLVRKHLRKGLARCREYMRRYRDD